MPQTFLMTGDALTGGYLRVVLSIPRSQASWVYSTFLGDLVEALNPRTWITAGESTPDDAAAIYRQIFETIKPMPIDPGDLKWTAAVALPTGAPWLACDGSSYLRVDYPALFAAIGITYGAADSTHFNVPDLRGETAIMLDGGRGKITDSWANTLGGEGGAATHTLVTSETPSHSHVDTGHTHTESVAFPAVGAAIVGVPIPSAVPAGGLTGVSSASLTNTGGNGDHNNIQPTIALNAYIYTGG
jgi:microcystin-dependent protein